METEYGTKGGYSRIPAVMCVHDSAGLNYVCDWCLIKNPQARIAYG